MEINNTGNMKKGKLTLIPIDGLCNRMRMINSAYDYLASGRKVKILWCQEEIINAKTTDLFILPPEIKVVNIDFSNKFCQLLFKSYHKFIYKTGILIDYYEIRKKPKEDIEKLFDKKNIILKSCYEILDRPGPNIFEPTDEIKERVEKVSAGKRYVSVHIRRTDHSDSKINSPTEMFEEIIRKEIQNGKEIFLATDDKQLKEELMKKYAPHIFSQEIAEITRGSVEGMKASYVDMLCMSKGEKVYGSFNSSFSKMAADLGGIELEVVAVEGARREAD